MRTPYKYFMNAVVHEDLFFAIYDYLRCNSKVAHKHDIKLVKDFDNLSVKDWKELAEGAIYWLDYYELQRITVIRPEDNAPSLDTWGTLYYQTLAYLAREKSTSKKLSTMDINELREVCEDCIDELKILMDEIHELTEDDLKNM